MNGRVLIIEPDPYEIGILSKVFSGLYETQFAANYKDAIEGLYEFDPEVVIYNVHVLNPDDLLSLNGAIKQCNYPIPVVLVVSDNHIEMERFAREQKVFYYLIKPYEFRVLEDALIAAMRFSRERRLEAQILTVNEKV